MFNRLFGLVEGLAHFLRVGIWRMRLSDLGGARRYAVRRIRIVALAIRGFDEDKCLLRASALTFYTLFAIVPVCGIAFAIAKTFFQNQDGMNLLEVRLKEMFSDPQMHEVIAQVSGFAESLLDRSKGSVIAGVGALILFWTVIKVLGNIESSFNEIFGARRRRPLMRRISDYLAVMVVAPIALISSGSATVAATTFIAELMDKYAVIGVLRPLIDLGLKTLPFLLLIAMFTFIYVFVPNVKVRFSSAMVAGFVAGGLYQIVQWTYIGSQVVVSKYNAIYGSFAALPLFLLWVQISWLIVLLGAEVAFAHQNAETYEFEPDCLTASPSLRKRAALRIVHLCVRNFQEGSEVLTAARISEITTIPIRLVRDLAAALIETGVLAEIRTEGNGDPAYQPARDLDQMTIHYVLGRMDAHGTDTLPFPDSEELSKIDECLGRIDRAARESPGNMKIKAI
ncbi:YihY/virulence factor BrkB family protein [Candidatus Sumerlaeota bacterium]|nr:YihY/virulence factor BrkB family protein [Candidatus Sumerlaeota bacterium]